MVAKPEVIDGLDSSRRLVGLGGISRNRIYFKDFFLLFSLLDVPYIYEGSSRRMFPWELGGPDSVG